MASTKKSGGSAARSAPASRSDATPRRGKSRSASRLSNTDALTALFCFLYDAKEQNEEILDLAGDTRATVRVTPTDEEIEEIALEGHEYWEDFHEIATAVVQTIAKTEPRGVFQTIDDVGAIAQKVRAGVEFLTGKSMAPQLPPKKKGV